jgi:hypothetical protein
MESAETVRSARRGSTARLETVVNIAVLVAALMVVAFFVDLFLSRNSNPPNPGVAPGMRLALPGSYDFAAKERTLILALQEGCSYCEESMPFYRKLSMAVASDCSGVGLVAAFPHPPPIADSLLAQHRLDLPRLTDLSLESLGVPGTPTLMLVDHSGKVLDVWVGRLSRDREEEVMAALQPVQACK